VTAETAPSERARIGWRCPVPVASYDRRPALSTAEADALAAIVACGTGAPWPAAACVAVQRLCQPLDEALAAAAVAPPSRVLPLRVVLAEMHGRGCTTGPGPTPSGRTY
jgi:hypothetical protein